MFAGVERNRVKTTDKGEKCSKQVGHGFPFDGAELKRGRQSIMEHSKGQMT